MENVAHDRSWFMMAASAGTSFLSWAHRTTNLLLCGLTRVEHREANVNVGMWLRDYVRCDHFANFSSRGGSCVYSAFNCSNITANDGSYQSGVNFLPAYEPHVGRFHHCVCGFNHGDKAAAFNHSQSFWHWILPHVIVLPK